MRIIYVWLFYSTDYQKKMRNKIVLKQFRLFLNFGTIIVLSTETLLLPNFLNS
jgi:hypothetical protein